MPTALIIGASRGLGRALAEEHLERGWQVIATVRDASALAATDALAVERLDTTDFDGIDALKAKLAGTTLDLLFVSAGIMGPGMAPIGDVSPDDYTQIMLTNVLGPLRIADRFADLTAANGTVAVMSSSLGSIGLNTTAGYEAYRTSKALDMGIASIAARRADQRTYLAVDPGWVQTDMGGPEATLTIDQSVPGIADMLAARHGTGGLAFITYANEHLPW